MWTSMVSCMKSISQAFFDDLNYISQMTLSQKRTLGRIFTKVYFGKSKSLQIAVKEQRNKIRKTLVYYILKVMDAIVLRCK